MRSFRKILIRLGVLLAFVILLESGVRFCYESWRAYTVVSKQERRELKGSLDTLYLGTSLAYRAFCPAVLDEKLGTNSFNLGTAQQSMMGTYYLLRETVEQNPVKQVYLSLSIATLKEESPDDSYVSAAENFCTLRWKLRYLAAVKKEPVFVSSMLYSTRVETYLNLSKIKKNVSKKLSGEKSGSRYGQRGFRGSKRIYKGDKANEKYTGRHYWDGSLGAEQIDAEAFEYLKKITEFCKQEKIRIIWVMTPITNDYLSGVGDMDNYDEVLRSLAEEWGAEVYNFILYKERKTVFPDNMFADYKHLNIKGGEAFSEELAKVMDAENPEDFFYDSMKEAEEQG